MSDVSDSYRYGFNGKENDFEPKNGQGTQQDYGMRIYDPRLGRFLSVDPLMFEYPWNSTYAFTENSPIENIDLDGGEKKSYVQHLLENKNDAVLTPITYGWDYVSDNFEKWYNQKSSTSTEIANSYQMMIAGEALGEPGAEKTNGEALAWTFAAAGQAMAQYSTYKSGLQLSYGKKAANKTSKSNVSVTQTRINNGVNSKGVKVNLITLKTSTPQTGRTFVSFSTIVKNGTINITGRSVTNGTFEYVITSGGELVLGTGHYNLSNGSTGVKAAGQLKLFKGKVMEITNNSGHYLPTIEEGEQSIIELNKLGVNTKDATVKLYGKDGKLEKTYKSK